MSELKHFVFLEFEIFLKLLLAGCLCCYFLFELFHIFHKFVLKLLLKFTNLLRICLWIEETAISGFPIFLFIIFNDFPIILMKIP